MLRQEMPFKPIYDDHSTDEVIIYAIYQNRDFVISTSQYGAISEQTQKKIATGAEDNSKEGPRNS